MSFFWQKNLWCQIDFLIICNFFWSNHFWIRCQIKVFLYWIHVSLGPKWKNLGSGFPSLVASTASHATYYNLPYLQLHRHFDNTVQGEENFRLSAKVANSFCSHSRRKRARCTIWIKVNSIITLPLVIPIYINTKVYQLFLFPAFLVLVFRF